MENLVRTLSHRLERHTWTALVGGEIRIQGNGVSVGIRDSDALRSRGHCRRDYRQRIHVLERDRRALTANRDRRPTLKAAAANSDLRSSGGSAGRWIQASDAQRNVRK